MKNNKELIMPSIIAIVSLFVVIIGATYAYYTVSTSNAFRTTNLGASLPEIGSVAIANGKNLSLNLTRPGMMQTSTDKVYYATENGTPVESQPTPPVIATATVTGNGTFTCTYTLHVAMSGDLYSAFQNMATKSAGQAILTINNTDYDFNSSTNFTSGFDVKGSLSGLTQTTPKTITAQFRIVNKKDINQTDLKGKSVTFTFTVSSFGCEANF